MREYRTVRLEIALTTLLPTKSQELAKAINRVSHITVVACQSYQKAISEKDTGGRVTSNRWMVAPSPTKNSQNSSLSGSASFRLVSSWIAPPASNSNTAHRVKAIAQFLQTVESMDSVVMNKNVGVRVHVHARGMTGEAVKRLVQLFVKYEAVLDSLVPESRRTGSSASNKFFQSIRQVLQNTAEAGGAGPTSSTPTNTLKNQLHAIELCPNIESLVELVNPTGSHYKLNLRHVTTAAIGSGGVESYIEFRQHSFTCNRHKIQSWISLCYGLIERAVSTNKAPLAFHSTRKLETQFQTLFISVVKDPKMRAFYHKRRRVLNAGERSTNGNRTASPAGRKPKKKAKVTATADAGAALSSEADASTLGKKKTSLKTKKKESDRQCGCCLEKLDTATGRRNKVCTCQEHGHVFCASCIVRYAQNELFANHNADLTCIAIGGNCKSPYNSRQLDAILPANVKHKLLEVQYENITAKRNGTVLWECPQCGAKGFVPKKEKTFSCPVGSCRLHSCRSCGEPAHPSKKCSEVEKQVVANARKSVEEAMSAVIIRHCPRCHSRVIWDSGCSHVTCQRCSTTLTGLPEYGQNRQAVRNAGTTALDRVEDRSTKNELTGIVERLV